MLFPAIRRNISRLLNPALCQVCGIPIRSDAFICRPCLTSLPLVQSPCRSCGLPNPADGDVCPKCLLHPPPWMSMTAPLVYTASVRHMIHDLKFNEQLYVANVLATHLRGFFQDQAVERIIPVPLHRERLLQRGFNQSAEIARILSRNLHIPFDLQSLKRIRATESQSGLSLQKRRHNLRRAFTFEPEKPIYTVAVLDDVITSGSTMREICKSLKRGGTRNIHVWSIARALRHD